MQKFTKIFILFLFIGALLSSCQKDINKYQKISITKWKPNVSIPFAKTTITFRDIIGNDSSIATNSDSSLVYVYHKNSVFSISADSLLQFSPQLSQQYSFSLGAIHFDDFSDSIKVAVYDILKYFNPQTADTLKKYNKTQNIFPPFQITNEFTLNMPEISFYKSLKFSKGTLEIGATNELPVTINTISYDLIDVDNNQVLKSIIINNLTPGATNTVVINLAGKTLGNKFKLVAHAFSSNGSYPNKVLIDLSKGLSFKFGTHNLTTVSGIAKITRQLAFSTSKVLDIDTKDGERLYKATLAAGKIDYTVQSSLNVGIQAQLVLLSALTDHQIPEQNFSIQANSSINDSWDLSNTIFDLTKDNLQKFNRLPVKLSVSLNPTNSLVAFDSSNRITATFKINRIKLSSAEGYLGKQKYQIDNGGFSFNLGFLNKISGSLEFSNPQLVLHYQNNFGIPIKAKLNFKAIKKDSEKSQNLNYDSVAFKYPKTAGQTVNDSIEVNKDNSSIVDFLALLPDTINYSGGFITNPDGLATNFISQNDVFSASADIKIPFSFKTPGISFADTVGFVSISPNDLPANSGSIIASVSNGFPFDISIGLIFPDSITGKTLRVLNLGTIHSANLNSMGAIKAPAISVIKVTIPAGFINDIQKANKLIVNVTVATFNHGTVPVQIFSDDKVKVTLGIRANINP